MSSAMPTNSAQQRIAYAFFRDQGQTASVPEEQVGVAAIREDLNARMEAAAMPTMALHEERSQLIDDMMTAMESCERYEGTETQLALVQERLASLQIDTQKLREQAEASESLLRQQNSLKEQQMATFKELLQVKAKQTSYTTDQLYKVSAQWCQSVTNQNHRNK